MQNKKSLTRWFFLLISVFIISLILWNTYSFFNQLKENERNKMRIWASAQSEVEQIGLSSEGVSEMVIEVLQSNTTTPMILYTHKEDKYDVRNIQEKKLDSVKTEGTGRNWHNNSLQNINLLKLVIMANCFKPFTTEILHL